MTILVIVGVLGVAIGSLYWIFFATSGPIEGDNVVIILSHRANTFELDQESMGMIEEYVMKSFQTTVDYNVEANVVFIVNDSRPRQVHIEGEGLYIEARNSHTRQRRMDTIGAEGGVLYNFLQSDSLNAVYEEVDMLGALWLASDVIRGMNGSGANYILSLDPGLSSFGNFNMRKVNIFDTDVEKTVAQRLEAAGMLPNLESITVVFGNLGAFGGVQSIPMQVESRNVFVDTWRDIIVRSEAEGFIYRERWQGGTSHIIHYGEEVPDDVARPEFNPPFVSTIIFPTIEPPTDYVNVIETERSAEVNLEMITFTNTELGFMANRSCFLDEDSASLVLEEIAFQITRYLEQDSERMIYIVGSVARLNRERPNAGGGLSEERAHRVREHILRLLVGQEHIEGRVIAVGANCEVLPWRNAHEWNEDGTWNEIQAELNRVTAIFSSADTESVQALENALENLRER